MTGPNFPRDENGEWIDPDDAPEWTDEMAEHAELSVGEKVIRPATGYLGPNGFVKGIPSSRDRDRELVTLAIDADVLAKFREDGPGWQGRINAVLRVAVGLTPSNDLS